MRRIYLNTEKTIFYVSNFTWDSFSKYLYPEKEVMVNLLVLLDKNEVLAVGPVVDRQRNQYEKPFEDMHLPTNWPLVNEIINTTKSQYNLYEYGFNINPNFKITSVTPTEQMFKSEGGKNVKNEIIDAFGKDSELYNLLKTAENNLNRMLALNTSNQAVEISKSEIIQVEDHIYSTPLKLHPMTQ